MEKALSGKLEFFLKIHKTMANMWNENYLSITDVTQRKISDDHKHLPHVGLLSTEKKLA